MLILNNIFKHIFLKNVNQIKRIRILTGYTSGIFLKFFVKEFPNIPIDVYLGMAQQGIKKNDHDIYLKLSKKSSFNLYYQVAGKDTHMKLFEIEYFNHKETYVGSANFSFSGMFEQNELMTLVDSVCDSLFLDQFNKSIKVSDPKAVELLLDCDEDYIGTDDISITNENQVRYSRICKPYTISFRRNSVFLSKFQVPLVTDTLNCKIYNKDGKTIIHFPSSFRVKTKFPINKRIRLFYEDIELKCVVNGKFNSRLQFENRKLEEILMEKFQCSLDLLEQKLLDFGVSYLLFERINETEYIISF